MTIEKGDNQSVENKSEILKAKIRNRYPDKTFENDDDYISRISDDYDDFDNQLNGYKEREQKITDLFTKDPKSAKFLDDWINDGDPRIQLLKAYGKEGIDAAFEDPETMEAMKQADKEFLENVAKEQELQKQWEQNRAESYSSIEQLQNEKGYTDEQVDEALAFLNHTAVDVVMGKYTNEAFEAAMHAINYDKDVANAEHIAEVRGRNEKIEEKLRKPKGDGMPQLAGGFSAPRQEHRLPGVLGREKKSIYELGGMKRTPRK